MILRMYSLSLDPDHPLLFSADEIRSLLNKKLAEYTRSRGNDTAGFIFRYPVLQYKQIKTNSLVTGIGQGADCLCQLTRDQVTLGAGQNTCRITARDPKIRHELFGVAATLITYEFLTPWIALNQQNAKKFYDLHGKPQRDAFMQKLLIAQLNTLAKSLNYDIPIPIICVSKVRFRQERIERENVMVFLGKFQTNLTIPDYLGIGQSVSKGYGTIQCIAESSDTYSGES
ncbi:MAG TPA: CRISPR-associated endonuclease Cas6 [Methanoregula sp.]|nr:CRISPR-associated endonuclease Cas6 [Methanoregula sp.]